jgi:hypothetical protein
MIRRLSSIATVVALAVAGMAIGVGTATAVGPCDRGTHCYGVGSYGPVRGNPPTYVNAVGSDLEVDCVGVTHPDTDWVNYEMWLDTGDGSDWIESGMTLGTLFAAPGQPQGFVWFWADQRSNGGGYHEHYIGPATTGEASNVSFYGAGNGNWDIYKAGSKVGFSSGVGTSSGGGSNGAESITTSAVLVGHTDSWGFYDLNNKWHLVSGEGFFNNSNGFFAGSASGSSISVSTPSGCAGAASAHRSTAIAVQPVTTSTVRAMATRTAKVLGDSEPANATYVRTNRGAAGQLVGAKVDTDQSVYVIQMTGKFKVPASPGAGTGHPAPTGTVLTVTVDAATGQVQDWGIDTTAPKLGTLGSVTSLS